MKIYVNVRALIDRQTAETTELLIQTRHKPHEGRTWLELPGGQLEPFEPLLDGLRREVLEETGLRLTQVEGESGRVQTAASESNVECLRPFAVYQTTEGPVDSLGVYFRCRAEGTLLDVGDDSKHPHWVSIDALKNQMSAEPEQFSWVDRAGLMFYFQEITSP